MATEFKSSIPIELLGNEGVMNLVSAGHAANDDPTPLRSTIKKFSIPEWAIEIATPIPAAPAPTIMTSCTSSESVVATSEFLFYEGILAELMY